MKILLQTLLNILLETLWLIAFLALGVLVGYLIFKLIELIIKKVALKKRTDLYEVTLASNIDIDELKNNISNDFKNEYSKMPISKRFVGLKDYIKKGVEEVALSYYPDSKDPIYEITVDNLFILSDDILKQIDKILNEVIDSKPFKLLWGGYAAFNNIKNFFRRKKEDNDYLNLEIRKQKLSFIAGVIESKKPKENDNKKTNEKETKTYFLVNDLINNKLCDFMCYVIDEADSLYSRKITSVKKVKTRA